MKKEKLIRRIQSSWRDWVRGINSEEEQFEKEGGKNYELQYNLEKVVKAYAQRREFAREVYTIELSIIKRAKNPEDACDLSIPHHIPKPKYL